MNTPRIAKSARIMQGAILVGDVSVGDDSSVWYNAVVRGDTNSIAVGCGTNIQDLCVLHTSTAHGVIVEDNITVGHSCVLHGCTIRSGAFIGMSSTILNGAIVEQDAMVGAGSLVTGGTVIPKGMLALGRPAKVVRALSPKEIKDNHKRTTLYISHAALDVQHTATPITRQKEEDAL